MVFPLQSEIEVLTLNWCNAFPTFGCHSKQVRLSTFGLLSLWLLQ